MRACRTIAWPTTTPADAAALVLMALSKVCTARDSDGAEEELEAAERGLTSALLQLTVAAGLTPEEMCFRDYLRD